jgi:acetylornithine/N-succinyldiaminopimelate aminotransferase
MFDEVQCGLGRTGTFLACEQYGVQADVVTLAKGLAGGIPAGAFLAGEKTADVLQSGDHGSTFGGNPLASAAGIAVLDTVANPSFLGEIKHKGQKFKTTLESWNHPCIKEVRARGMMLGIDLDTEAWPILERALKENPGLLLLSAGTNTLRLLPPYIISDTEIEEGLDILKKMLN